MKTLPSTASSSERRSWYLVLGVGCLWVVSYLLARFVLEAFQLDHWLRVTVALLPVAPTALFLWLMIANIRSMDELHRRVHLEALAIAYPLAILLLWTLGLLQLVIDLPSEDWSYRHVWVYLPLFYFVGLAISWRRYQ